MNLLNNVEVRVVNGAIANASNTDSNSSRIDMQGWDGVMFVTPIEDSAATGVAKLQVEQNTADSDGGMAALSGASAQATCGTNDDLNSKALVVDVYRPAERYVQGVLTSTTALMAFGPTLAILYRGSKMPTTLGTTIAASAKVVSPSEV